MTEQKEINLSSYYFKKNHTDKKGKDVVINSSTGEVGFEDQDTSSVKNNETYNNIGENLTNQKLINDSINTKLGQKANSSHTHTKSQITDFNHTHDDRYYTETEMDTKLNGKANSSHTHTKSQITDFSHTHDDRYYTETETNTKLNEKAPNSHAVNASTYGLGTSDVYGHVKLDTSLTDEGPNPVTGAAIKGYIDNVVNSIVTGQVDLSGTHNHDNRYYTETEIDTKLNGKANSSHTHDDKYYTENEIDTKLENIVSNITTGEIDLSETHNHDDRYYTETEIDTKLNGKANNSHTHGNITNAGAIGSTANLPIITDTNGVLKAGSFGTAANTFCQGNDSRLSNARTPVFNHIGATNSATKDLNNYTTGGFYYCNNDNNEAPYISNQPWTSGQKAFFLLVETWGASSTNYTKQTLTYYTTNQTYTRTKANTAGWSSWVEISKDTVYSHPSTHAASMITDATAHSNIGSAANATQATINTAIDTALSNKQAKGNYLTSVSSSNIVDGTIVNADINANAAIAASKIADGTAHSNIGSTANDTQATINTKIDTALSGKQAAGNYLTAHQTLKTINNTSLVGSGNISVVTDVSGKLDKTQSSNKGKVLVTNASTGVIEFEDKAGYVKTSSTPGYIKNDGTIGTPTNTTYTADESTLTKNSNNVFSLKDSSNYIKKSSTSGYIKNDGTIGTPTDTNTTYTADESTLTKSSGNVFSLKDSSNYIKKSSTSGYIKNDGTVGTPTNTTYTADTGLSLSNSNAFSVNFGGSTDTDSNKAVACNDSRLSNSRIPSFGYLDPSNVSTLDGLTTGGFYYCNNDNRAKQISGCPLSQANNLSFFLLVETWGASNATYVKQTLTYYKTYGTYIRVRNDNGWGSWVEITKDTVYTHPNTHNASMIIDSNAHINITSAQNANQQTINSLIDSALQKKQSRIPTMTRMDTLTTTLTGITIRIYSDDLYCTVKMSGQPASDIGSALSLGTVTTIDNGAYLPQSAISSLCHNATTTVYFRLLATGEAYLYSNTTTVQRPNVSCQITYPLKSRLPE